MRNFTYLRPGNLYKDFVIEENTGEIGSRGRAITKYDESGTRILKGALAEASEKQKMRWEQLQHPVTHMIVQNGRPKAKAADRLIRGNRVFLIQGVEEPGELGICTIYYAEERSDVR